MTDEEREFFEKATQKTVIRDSLPNKIGWHVCTLTPQPEAGKNNTGKCDVCGATVYFSSSIPDAKKICMPCLMKKEPDPAKINSVTTKDTLIAVAKSIFNHQTRN